MRSNIDDQHLLGNRYMLTGELGRGGMGIVHQAYDRLTGQAVALKRVLAKSEASLFDSQTAGINLKLALAREFRLLASLRHPHIISVLDYGFDAEQQPFYTMELVQQPRTILEAAADQPIHEKLNLIIQVLQALAYLHRRGIIHSDVKPSNVLVEQGEARVLDFGLSITADAVQPESGTTGTLAYLAPECLMGSPISAAADLYAVGVITYQLLAGQHPYQADSISALIQAATYEPLNLGPLAMVSPAIQAVITRLLDKTPEARYADANEVIRALSDALNQALPPETTAIRDSYLQAARFVGRESELQIIENYLDQMQNGQGGTLLIGGESGVGKSRLLEEIRTLALVRGALVLRGQSVPAGGALYGLWRPILRWLALITDLTDAEAAILKPLIADLEQLLGRAVPDAPEVDPRQAKTRLLDVLETIFRRHASQQGQPILLMLENLHWSSESLIVLRHLMTFAPDLPLLIIGSYRDDEQPDLPDELPGAARLRLERLPEASIADLTESMLGAAGRYPDLISLLKRETEGNVFFLVEVVRALANEVGQLAQVAAMQLPDHVFAGGIQQILQRRLERIPDFARPLLMTAAAAGRYLDLALLHHIAPEIDLDTWLTVGSNAAVLEVHEEQWRFSHDRLREALLMDQPPAHLQTLHHQIAAGLETLYPDNPDKLGLLAHHWAMAHQPERTAHYAESAGDQAMDSGVYRESAAYYRQAIQAVRQMPDSADQQQRFIDLSVKRSRASALHLTPDVLENLQEAHQLAEALHDEQRLARVIASMGAYDYMRGEMGGAFRHFARSMQMAEQLGLDELLVLPYNILGRSMIINGEIRKGIQMLRRGIDLAYRFKDEEMAVGSEGFLGAVLYYVGEIEEAEQISAACIQHALDLGLNSRVAGNHMLLGFTYTLLGALDRAEQHLQTVLNTMGDNPEPQLTFMTYGAFGFIHLWRDDLEAAVDALEKGINIAQARGLMIYVPMFQSWRGEVDLRRGDTDAAQERVAAALELARQTRQRKAEAEALRVLGNIAAAGGAWDQAETYFQESLTAWETCGIVTLCEHTRLDYARMLHQQGEADRAREILQAVITTCEGGGMVDFAAAARQMLDT